MNIVLAYMCNSTSLNPQDPSLLQFSLIRVAQINGLSQPGKVCFFFSFFFQMQNDITYHPNFELKLESKLVPQALASPIPVFLLETEQEPELLVITEPNSFGLYRQYTRVPQVDPKDSILFGKLGRLKLNRLHARFGDHN